MSTARWAFYFDGQTCFIAGPKTDARRRIAACGDRSPLWVPRRAAWATSPAVARKVLDQLDARRIAYTLEDTAQAGLDLTVDLTLNYTEPEPAPAEKPNWRGITYRAAKGVAS